MNNLLTCSAQLLAEHNFWVALGQVVAAAMVVGALLDESWRRLRNWVVAGIVFAAIEQYIRYSFRVDLGFAEDFLCESNAISFMVALTYSFGLIVGWVIVFLGKHHGRITYLKQSIQNKEENEQ